MTGQKAQALALVALLLVVLVGIVALGIDGGHGYLQRRQMQTAADAGALAAAKAYCAGEGWQAAGESFCGMNGAQSCVVTMAPGGGRVVQVQASVTVPTSFAGVLGITSLTASAMAQATCSPPMGVADLVPMVVKLPGGYMFEEGEEVDLWIQEEGESGAFGWVDWPSLYNTPDPCTCSGTGQGIPELECVIEQPWCSPYLSVDQWYTLAKNGAAMNPLVDVMRAELLCNPEGIVVPLYDDRTGGGATADYHIVGFGRFIMTGICTGHTAAKQWHCDCPGTGYACTGVSPLPMPCGPSDVVVRGYFVEEVVPGPGDPNADFYGTYVVHLLR